MMSVMLSHTSPLREGGVKNASQALFENSLHLTGAAGALLHPAEIPISWI